MSAAAHGALAAVTVLLAGAIAYHANLDFDPALNFLLYRDWVKTGLFAYGYAPDLFPFNPQVTTGPTVNAPLGVAYALLGARALTAASAGLVALTFAGLALAFWRAIPRAAYLSGASVVALLVFLASRDFLSAWIPFETLGEMPAFVLVFLGATRLFGEKRGGAVLLGMAVLTKFTVVCGVAAVVVWYALWRRSTRDTVTVALIAGLPHAVFFKGVPWTLAPGHRELLTQIRRGWGAYEWKLGAGGLLALQHGVEAFGSAAQASLATLAAARGSWVALGFDAIVLGLVTGTCMYRALHERESSLDALTAGLGLFACGLLAWYVMVASQTTPRYVFPAECAWSAALALTLARCLCAAYDRIAPSRRRIAAATIAMALAATQLIASGRALPDALVRVHEAFATGAAQRQFVATLETIATPERRLFALGWFQVPALQALADVSVANLHGGLPVAPGDLVLTDVVTPAEALCHGVKVLEPQDLSLVLIADAGWGFRAFEVRQGRGITGGPPCP